MREMWTADEPVRVQALSGEPLSPELEAKIAETLEVMVKAAVCPHDGAGHGHEYERDALLPILRAFAREIQQAEHDSRDYSKQNGLELDLLASQERCRTLSETAKPLLRSLRVSHKCWYKNGVPARPWDSDDWNRDCPTCAQARDLNIVQACSSEAGRGKIDE